MFVHTKCREFPERDKFFCKKNRNPDSSSGHRCYFPKTNFRSFQGKYAAIFPGDYAAIFPGGYDVIFTGDASVILVTNGGFSRR